MSHTMRMEQLSRAYVKAVAATAGVATTSPSVDDDSIDLGLSARGVRRPRVEMQLKATAASAGGPEIPFRLERKNYDDLRITDLIVPRILVVVMMPTRASEWLEQSEDVLLMHCIGYWMSLRGQPGDGRATTTVHVPKKQVFTTDALSAMLRRIAERGLP